MNTRENVLAVIDGIQDGKVLETFDKYYSDDVIMSENGADPRVGKAVNRAYEQAFVDNVEFHGARVGQVVSSARSSTTRSSSGRRPCIDEPPGVVPSNSAKVSCAIHSTYARRNLRRRP